MAGGGSPSQLGTNASVTNKKLGLQALEQRRYKRPRLRRGVTEEHPALGSPLDGYRTRAGSPARGSIRAGYYRPEANKRRIDLEKF
jgi:hypothetical protein